MPFQFFFSIFYFAVYIVWITYEPYQKSSFCATLFRTLLYVISQNLRFSKNFHSYFSFGIFCDFVRFTVLNRSESENFCKMYAIFCWRLRFFISCTMSENIQFDNLSATCEKMHPYHYLLKSIINFFCFLIKDTKWCYVIETGIYLGIITPWYEKKKSVFEIFSVWGIFNFHNLQVLKPKTNSAEEWRFGKIATKPLPVTHKSQNPTHVHPVVQESGDQLGEGGGSIWCEIIFKHYD